MKKVIALMLMLALASASGIYVAQINYKDGEFTAGPMYKTDGQVGLLQEPVEGYLVKIVTESGENLFIRKFSPPLFKHRDTFTADKGIPIVELNETTFGLALPYYADGETIEIYDKERELVLEIDVSRFKVQKEVGHKATPPSDLTLIITGVGILALLIGGVVIYLRNRGQVAK